MERKTLLLSTALLMLTPFAQSATKKMDFGLGLAAGSRMVTIGDPTATTTLNLLGNAKQTTTVTPAGTVTQLAHTAPSAILNTYVQYGMSDHSSIRVNADIYMAKSDTRVLYNGQSTTAAVVLKASKPVLTFTANTDGTIDDDASATVGISSITSGKRECTVDHQTAYGFNVRYAFGSDSKLSLGAGMLRTADEYKYTVEEPPAGGTADSGVYSATDTDFSENFIIGGTAVTDNTAITDGADQTNPTHVQTKNFTPVLGTVATYSDGINWVGVVGDAEANVNDNIVAYAGFGYYWNSLPISKNATISAPMIVKATDAVLSVGHFGISYCKAH